MKKIISLLIALAALVCAAPTAISGDDPATDDEEMAEAAAQAAFLHGLFCAELTRFSLRAASPLAGAGIRSLEGGD